jgi:tetratricopeptide (TPR) repeat protein
MSALTELNANKPVSSDPPTLDSCNTDRKSTPCDSSAASGVVNDAESIENDLYANGPPEEIIAFITEKIKRNPNAPELYIERGTWKMTAQRFKEAIEDFDQAKKLLQLKTRHLLPTVYCYRGECFAMLGDHEHAVEDFKHATVTDICPGSCKIMQFCVLFSLAKSKLALGDYPGARQDAAISAKKHNNCDLVNDKRFWSICDQRALNSDSDSGSDGETRAMHHQD